MYYYMECCLSAPFKSLRIRISEKNIRYYENIHTTPHKSTQKREILKTLYKVDICKNSDL